MAKYNIFETYETMGRFWFDEAKENKYPGVLKYSPTEGITLEVLCEKKPPDDVRRVYGITDEFKKVTLTEAFFSRGPLLKVERDFDIVKLTISARKLLIGLHLSEQGEADIQKVSFSMNQLDEFCFPQGQKGLDKYIKGDLFQSSWGSHASISLSQRITHNSSGGLHNFYIENDEFKSELIDKIAEICDKYNDDIRYKIKDMKYRIKIEKKKGAPFNLKNFFDEMYSFRTLFFILVIKPVYFQSIFIYVVFDEMEEKGYEILTSPKLDEKSLKKVQEDLNHYFLPVKFEDIKDNFSDLSQNWLNFLKKPYYENLAGLLYIMAYKVMDVETALFYYTAFMKVIRQWVIGHNKNVQKEEYYDWFINTYASYNIKNKFITILRKANKDIQVSGIGKELADIRNYIEHADVPNEHNKKRFKTYSQEITKTDYLNLCELFYILFIKALYKDLGVPTTYLEENDGPFRQWQSI